MKKIDLRTDNERVRESEHNTIVELYQNIMVQYKISPHRAFAYLSSHSKDIGLRNGKGYSITGVQNIINNHNKTTTL